MSTICPGQNECSRIRAVYADHQRGGAGDRSEERRVGKEWRWRWSPATQHTQSGDGCEEVATFFFQAEDGIRDFHVTGVQTCALPICPIHTALLFVLDKTRLKP